MIQVYRNSYGAYGIMYGSDQLSHIDYGDLKDLHSILDDVLETKTVKEPVGKKPYNRGNPKEMWCLDCPVHCAENILFNMHQDKVMMDLNPPMVFTPPSNSEKDSEKEEWTHNLAARELKRDYPEETAGYNLDQIAEMYHEWSEDNYCAGWMTPCKEYVERCFRQAKKEEVKEEMKCSGHCSEMPCGYRDCVYEKEVVAAVRPSYDEPLKEPVKKLPSERIYEILNEIRLKSHSDVEIDYMRFKALVAYLDETQ